MDISPLPWDRAGYESPHFGSGDEGEASKVFQAPPPVTETTRAVALNIITASSLPHAGKAPRPRHIYSGPGLCSVRSIRQREAYRKRREENREAHEIHLAKRREREKVRREEIRTYYPEVHEERRKKATLNRKARIARKKTAETEGTTT
ncbi:MAG: hypothetical protein JSR76_03705 [Verrucomicrobia bacterium]|nr:hypothetical protein [Verrucomicrobiota bacterium]